MERTELEAIYPQVAAVLPDRMVAKLVHVEASGCLLYQGACTKDGYPQVKVDGKVLYAHRHTWELVNGRPILPRHDLDHLKADRPVAPGPCTARNCICPAHVEEVPREVNRGVRMRRKVDTVA